jgi:hypothetical protein
MSTSRARRSTLKKAEPIDWYLDLLSEDDPSLPAPRHEMKLSFLSPDEFELWKLHETREFGGLFPTTARDHQVKLALKREKKERRLALRKKKKRGSTK